jgi:hypothetical protein
MNLPVLTSTATDCMHELGDTARHRGKCMSWPQAAEYNIITNKQQTRTHDARKTKLKLKTPKRFRQRIFSPPAFELLTKFTAK